MNTIRPWWNASAPTEGLAHCCHVAVCAACSTPPRMRFTSTSITLRWQTALSGPGYPRAGIENENDNAAPSVQHKRGALDERRGHLSSSRRPGYFGGYFSDYRHGHRHVGAEGRRFLLEITSAAVVAERWLASQNGGGEGGTLAPISLRPQFTGTLANDDDASGTSLAHLRRYDGAPGGKRQAHPGHLE